METNEQGLTKEEKLMFSILAIILIVAIGVLIINSFSSNERKLEDNNTPITETQGQENNIKDETITSNQEESLIEDTPVVNIVKNTATSNKTSTKHQQTSNIVTNTDNKIPENNVPGLVNWSIKETIITEAYTNDVIIVDKMVTLDDGTEVEAAVTIRKLEGNSWNIVELTNDEFTCTEGTYKYYYTYSNQTKEVLLIVKNKLEYENIKLLTLTDNYLENSEISEEEFNKYQNILLNTKITKEEQLTLTIHQTEQTSLVVPLLLTLNEDLLNKEVNSKTLGIITTTENQTWYQEITSKDIIIWIDLSLVDITNQEIIINIDNIDYYLYLNIILTEEDINEETPSEDETDSDIVQDEEIIEEDSSDNQEEFDKIEPNEDTLEEVASSEIIENADNIVQINIDETNSQDTIVETS